MENLTLRFSKVVDLRGGRYMHGMKIVHKMQLLSHVTLPLLLQCYVALSMLLAFILERYKIDESNK